jgi:hypothetical protein
VNENPAPQGEDKKQDLEKAPAIGIQLSTQLGPDRALNLSCWLPLDCSVRDLNSTLDKFWSAADRLEARSKIVVLEKTLEALERDRKDATKNIAKIDFARSAREHEAKSRGKQGPLKSPANEDETRRAYETAIEEYTAKIAKFTADLADMKKVAYDGVSDGGTNL